MKCILSLIRIGFVLIIIYFTLLATGCVHFQALTYENKTALPVKVIEYAVSRGSTVIPKRIWNDPGTVIAAGESKTLLEDVSQTRNGGKYYNYAVIAVTETNDNVLSKVYTWDELHDANWKVLITAQQ